MSATTGPGSAAGPDPGSLPDPATLDYDPTQVPIRPAATVMLVADRPDLHVLMLRRSARQVFATSMWVYPGGAVDPGDAAEAAGFCDGLDDPAASHRLGVEAGGLAYWVAAIRECFEEAGVLFSSLPEDPAALQRLAAARDALNRHEVDFLDIVRAERLRLQVGRLHQVAHWITPPGPPRRFNTRFFLAAFPEGQVAAHDRSESVHHEWVRPADALAAWREERMAMMSPTARMLMCLLPFDSAVDAVAAAAAARPPHAVRVNREGPYRIMLPGDDGYDDGDPDRVFGWVSLRPAP
jgi:8-oxo-dGTP pyrophosphatase MutT (NUDIX family)